MATNRTPGNLAVGGLVFLVLVTAWSGAAGAAWYVQYLNADSWGGGTIGESSTTATYIHGQRQTHYGGVNTYADGAGNEDVYINSARAYAALGANVTCFWDSIANSRETITAHLYDGQSGAIQITIYPAMAYTMGDCGYVEYGVAAQGYTSTSGRVWHNIPQQTLSDMMFELLDGESAIIDTHTGAEVRFDYTTGSESAEIWSWYVLATSPNGYITSSSGEDLRSAVIPEPATLAIVALGASGVILRRRRR